MEPSDDDDIAELNRPERIDLVARGIAQAAMTMAGLAMVVALLALGIQVFQW